MDFKILNLDYHYQYLYLYTSTHIPYMFMQYTQNNSYIMVSITSSHMSPSVHYWHGTLTINLTLAI